MERTAEDQLYIDMWSLWAKKQKEEELKDVLALSTEEFLRRARAIIERGIRDKAAIIEELREELERERGKA